MSDQRMTLASWLAADAGIPYAVQHLFDLSEYEAEAERIVEGEQ